jgi:hypothetical protein
MYVTPSAPVHELQCGVLHEINQLNEPRQGIIEMEVDICLPSISLPCCFAKQDIFALPFTTTGHSRKH